MASEFFGRQCRFYTAGCGNKMAVSVTGPRAVNELGRPVIPGNLRLCLRENFVKTNIISVCCAFLLYIINC